jgi:hypothetical protein
VARRVTAISRERDGDPELLLISAGDFYGGKGIIDIYRARYLSEKMMEMGYDAVALGERELGHGPKPILKQAEGGLPVICANLFGENEPVFPPSIVKQVRGWKIGIFALLGEDPRESGGLELRDPVIEGSRTVEQLEGEGCDLIIMLAHMNRERLVEILAGLNGVDIVIRGHARGRSDAAESCADTLGGLFETIGVPVFFAGDRGRILGKIALSPGEEGSFSMQSELIYLDGRVWEDSVAVADLRAYFALEAEKRREIQMNEFLSRDQSTGALRERYLGQAACGKCHTGLTDRLAVSRHYRAYETLLQRGEERNPDCLSCHTTGFGRYSGFDPAREVRTGKDLRGVQCEECHGPGTTHSRDGAYIETARNSCSRCHTSYWSPDFDFESYWERIPHCGGTMDGAR